MRQFHTILAHCGTDPDFRLQCQVDVDVVVPQGTAMVLSSRRLAGDQLRVLNKFTVLQLFTRSGTAFHVLAARIVKKFRRISIFALSTCTTHSRLSSPSSLTLAFIARFHALLISERETYKERLNKEKERKRKQ